MHWYGVPGADPDYFRLLWISPELTRGHPLVYNSNVSFQLGDGVGCVWRPAGDIQFSVMRMCWHPSRQLCPRVQLCITQIARNLRLIHAGLSTLDAQRQTSRNRMWQSRSNPVYDWNQSSTLPTTPNWCCNRVSSSWWSTVSKAAERSWRHSALTSLQFVDNSKSLITDSSLCAVSFAIHQLMLGNAVNFL